MASRSDALAGHPKAARFSGRLGWFALIGVLGGVLVAFVAVSLATTPPTDIGMDFRFYRDVGARWLTDGSYYLPRQLAGPYDVQLMADVLYPPHALVLFVPFAFLPAILWWAVPIGVTLYIIRDMPPAPWAVVGMLLLLMWPRAHAAFIFGNSDMWMMAAVAAGLRWGWPALLVTIKPTVAVLALVGLRRRSWWVVVGLLALASLPMLPLWFDYALSVRNLRIDPWYSLGSLPLLLIPVVAWLGR